MAKLAVSVGVLQCAAMSTATIIALAVACVLLVILLVLVARAARSRRLEQRRRLAGELRRVINSWLVTVVEGAAETIALAEGAGVDPHQFCRRSQADRSISRICS
jgi:3-hydroxyisobutyrate dehydrogenase